MKSRKGFVTNSSSSSFVIATKPGIGARIAIEMDLSKCIDYTLKTKKDVIDYLIYVYSYKNEYTEDNLPELFMDNDCAKEQYDLYMQFIEAGKYVHIGIASDEDVDNTAGMYIRNNGLPPSSDYDILQNCD